MKTSDQSDRVSPFHSFAIWLVLASWIAIGLSGCNHDDDDTQSNGVGPVGQNFKLFGLNFSPYLDGQSPNLGTVIDGSQMNSRMEIISDSTNWIRTYSTRDGLDKAGEIAHSLSLNAAIGAWIGRNNSDNDEEIANLIAIAQAGHADMLIVGSEAILRRDVEVDELIAYIQSVRDAVPDIQIAYADLHWIFLNNPALIDAVDVVLANYYPYWDGVDLDNSVAAVHHWHTALQDAAGSKPVMVSETGWPDCGGTVGAADASSQNASDYFLNIVSWARANNIEYFYFEAFDEAWKVADEGPQGACWGVWDRFGNLKNGMSATLNGATVPDNWSSVTIPGGPGDPAIEFTFVPPVGSFDNLRGRVLHVSPFAARVAVYILVRGRWWTKPFFDRPLTLIQIDGSWTTDITTGGIDSQATQIAAFLVPLGYDPPLLGGARNLPVELQENSLASVQVTR